MTLVAAFDCFRHVGIAVRRVCADRLAFSIFLALGALGLMRAGAFGYREAAHQRERRDGPQAKHNHRRNEAAWKLAEAKWGQWRIRDSKGTKQHGTGYSEYQSKEMAVTLPQCGRRGSSDTAKRI